MLTLVHRDTLGTQEGCPSVSPPFVTFTIWPQTSPGGGKTKRRLVGRRGIMAFLAALMWECHVDVNDVIFTRENRSETIIYVVDNRSLWAVDKLCHNKI